MKIRITMKDPDAPYEAARDAAKASVAAAVENGTLSQDEAELVIEDRQGTLTDTLAKWFSYGEYLTVEFDTEAGTAVVLERGSK